MLTSDVVMKELERITGTDQVRVDPDLSLYEEGVLDSLGTIELIVALSETCHINISPTEVDRQLWATPRKIIAFVEARAGA